MPLPACNSLPPFQRPNETASPGPSTIASGTNGSVLFGDFSYYHVKDFRTLRLVRFTEPHAEADAELWAAYQRSSGNLIDSATHPVVALCH